MKSKTPIFLIADNNDWVVRLSKWRLELLLGKEINVITGSNGEDAVNSFPEIVRCGNHSQIQFVLLGCHMPVYTGMEAAAEIRNIERENNISRPAEIIGTSADLNDEICKEFLGAGASYVRSKPIPVGELEGLCSQILNNRKLEGT